MNQGACTYDVVILTDDRYVNPAELNAYTNNVLKEDMLVQQALEAKGLKVSRKSWSDPNFNWNSAGKCLFRSTWDYFERFDEFSTWLKKVNGQTELCNPEHIIRWNLDKHYLRDLEGKGIRIAPTLFLERGRKEGIKDLMLAAGWEKCVLKPCISGAGRHTYLITEETASNYDTLLHSLLKNESMMLQEFQHQVVRQGEISIIIIDGKVTHAVLKKARPGEFRVQDDFGGTVTLYEPTKQEIDFALKVMEAVDQPLLYARVDIFRDNTGEPALAELELIEPELWFRLHPGAAETLAMGIDKF
ncbi:ATP-grasp domain-containing protein [Robertkochia aurantiaca]|uniref:ATP-grasp domain-containing protein n=1 Tax=Robertkochia aurantiaca TaxID=2873700 RepID=UPI001CCA597D|nr:hypothetical protein [Robertkochia sp. 3YJGBD-33]